MKNIREGSVRVYLLKKEIQRDLSILYRMVHTSKVEEQISDGEKFLKLLGMRAYVRCQTVDEIEEKLTLKRNKLKKQLVMLDENQDGHQITLLEIFDDFTEREKRERQRKVKNLKEEIDWLNKCLKMCKNKDYFR